MVEKTVLVVEDDAVLARLLAQVLELEMEGLRPLLARDVPEAEALLARQRADLVLTDLWSDVYGEHAWEPVARLRRAAGDAPILVCTAHSGAAQEDLAARGVSGVILKPFDLDDVVARVGRVLGQREQDGEPTPCEPARA